MTGFLAVVNPAAGGGRCGKRAPEAIRSLRDQGIEVEVVETAGPGQASDLVRDAYAQGQRDFIAVGGDGTSYEIVNGLFPGAEDPAERPSLGFLPMGTGNSFLRDFTDEGAQYSMKALVEGRRRPCDVVRVSHAAGELHYINLLSIGFVADVNGLRDRRFRAFGESGYILAVVTEVARLGTHVFPMAVDGGEFDRDPVVFVSMNNSRFTGGKMMMAPEADPSDGQIDLIRVGPLGRISLLRTFPQIFKGTHIHHPSVTTTRASAIDFELSDEIDVMVDGEAVRIVPKRLEVLSGALDVRV